VGRQGNIDDLNLAAAGIEPTIAGAFRWTRISGPKRRTFSRSETFIGFPALASVSMEQGRIAAARAFGDEHIISNPSFYPYGILSIPEISFIARPRSS